MPLIADSSYAAPPGFANGHWQTIYPTLFRRLPAVGYRHERLELADGDFLDLDWLASGRSRLAILSHGLEGSSQSNYIRGMALALHRRGWDVLAWNCRGCGGEANRLLRFYHSGATEDLDAVVRHALSLNRYQRLALVGFSLGGNMTLKYLGEQGSALDERIARAAAFSVPCDLAGSSRKMAEPANRVYMWRFMRCLRWKVRRKMPRFPGRLSDAGLDRMRTFQEFDDAYTAPLHGFNDAEDYWERSGSGQFLPRITIPTLLVNARNDPFLSEGCFPIDLAREHEWLHIEVPASGGHVGFVTWNGLREYWSETRAAEFLE